MIKKNGWELAKWSETKVKQRLWTFGYKVRHLGTTGSFDYDLLVEDKYRVEVKATQAREVRGKLKWTVYLPVNFTNEDLRWDILATVLVLPNGKPRITFFSSQTILENFPHQQTLLFTEDKWKLGTESPSKVFGKPKGRNKK